MNEKKDRSLISLMRGFIDRTSEDHVAAYAAQAAFFMIMSFMSLPVIPKIKMTTKGLIDVQKQELVSLFSNDICTSR